MHTIGRQHTTHAFASMCHRLKLLLIQLEWLWKCRTESREFSVRVSGSISGGHPGWCRYRWGANGRSVKPVSNHYFWTVGHSWAPGKVVTITSIHLLVDSRAQFHQRSACSFYVRKLRMQLFWAYTLGLYLTGARLLAQKLRVERWWNWAQESISTTHWRKVHIL